MLDKMKQKIQEMLKVYPFVTEEVVEKIVNEVDFSAVYILSDIRHPKQLEDALTLENRVTDIYLRENFHNSYYDLMQLQEDIVVAKEIKSNAAAVCYSEDKNLVLGSKYIKNDILETVNLPIVDITKPLVFVVKTITALVTGVETKTRENYNIYVYTPDEKKIKRHLKTKSSKKTLDKFIKKIIN
ncbi:MAG: hypothetical protein RR922_05595 [Clostridia bacterium]